MPTNKFPNIFNKKFDLYFLNKDNMATNEELKLAIDAVRSDIREIREMLSGLARVQDESNDKLTSLDQSIKSKMDKFVELNDKLCNNLVTYNIVNSARRSGDIIAGISAISSVGNVKKNGEVKPEKKEEYVAEPVSAPIPEPVPVSIPTPAPSVVVSVPEVPIPEPKKDPFLDFISEKMKSGAIVITSQKSGAEYTIRQVLIQFMKDGIKYDTLPDDEVLNRVAQIKKNHDDGVVNTQTKIIKLLIDKYNQSS